MAPENTTDSISGKKKTKWSLEKIAAVCGVITVIWAVLIWIRPQAINPTPSSERNSYDVEVPAKGKVRLKLYSDKGQGACVMSELDNYPYRPAQIKIGAQKILLTWKENTGPNASAEPYITEPFNNIIRSLPDRPIRADIDGSSRYATIVPTKDPGKIVVDIIKPGEPIVNVAFKINWESH